MTKFQSFATLRLFLDPEEAGRSFEAIEVDNPIIEVIMAKKELIKLMGRDRLTQVVIEEVARLMEDSSLLHIGLNVKLISTKAIEVPDNSST